MGGGSGMGSRAPRWPGRTQWPRGQGEVGRVRTEPARLPGAEFNPNDMAEERRELVRHPRLAASPGAGLGQSDGKAGAGLPEGAPPSTMGSPRCCSGPARAVEPVLVSLAWCSSRADGDSLPIGEAYEKSSPSMCTGSGERDDVESVPGTSRRVCLGDA
jgi:hypothetical protein